ncbi:MAG: family 43 glycosylhydrolase [Bacteroidaceae bacterium]|nr:family 43 glycosylhydrolase [Bacteroidaceae bacterium]
MMGVERKTFVRLLLLFCLWSMAGRAQEVTRTMPLFYNELKATLTYPMSWDNASSSQSFRKWRKKGRAKVLECMSPAPPLTKDWDMEIVAEEQRDGYVARKILFNVNDWCRVPAYLLVPDAPEGAGKQFPAVLALHDHGAHFSIGKEKMVRPFGVSEEVLVDAESWSYACYDGMFVGDRLAQHGYVVLAVDALLWGERGRKEGPDYDAQQALNANLEQMGMSFGSFIAWDDLRCVSFLNSLPFVKKNQIATLGHSMGAHRAWMTAALTDEVAAAVAVCWMNTTDSLMTLTNNQNRGGSAYSMLIPGLRRWLDYPDVASLACPKPVLFMNGRYDKLFPVAGVEDAYAKMRNVWTARGAESDFHARIVEGPHYYSLDMQRESIQFLDSVFGIASQQESESGAVRNPILPADYSDPDVIRVGDTYYMTCSDFHFMGMPVLESFDLVNWRVVSHAYDSIPLPGYSSMERYAQGSWAPAIRYHDGRFWIFFCTPHDGLFMTTAERAEGPWEPLHLVKAVDRWEDPCPFWDDDGNAYLGHSLHGAGPIIVHRMSPDGRQLLDEGVTVYEGPVAEGTKFLKKDGWYYLCIPEGGVATGWQTALRARSIYGPYEGRRVLEQGSTAVNGPHQGALVDTPEGTWWFYHFQQTDPLGRIVHLQPVVWKDGFPFIGEDVDGNGIGEPVAAVSPLASSPLSPSASQGDWANGPHFGVTSFGSLLWQWNHNPHPANYARSDSTLRLYPMQANTLRQAPNQYTLKTVGSHSRACVQLDYGAMTLGQRAGLECLGSAFNAIGVEMCEKNGRVLPFIYTEFNGEVTYHGALPAGKDDARRVWLYVDVQSEANRHQLWYSVDGITPRFCGPVFEEHPKDWKGSRVGLFAYSLQAEGEERGGFAEFARFGYHRME